MKCLLLLLTLYNQLFGVATGWKHRVQHLFLWLYDCSLILQRSGLIEEQNIPMVFCNKWSFPDLKKYHISLVNKCENMRSSFSVFFYSQITSRRWRGESRTGTIRFSLPNFQYEFITKHCMWNSNDFQVESFYELSADLSTGDADTSDFHHFGYAIFGQSYE